MATLLERSATSRRRPVRRALPDPGRPALSAPAAQRALAPVPIPTGSPGAAGPRPAVRRGVRRRPSTGRPAVSAVSRFAVARLAESRSAESGAISGAVSGQAVSSRTRLGPVPHLRLTGRGRTVASLLAVALLTGGGALGHGPGTEAGPVDRPTDRVVVQPGDTLWSIAGRVAPDADRRQTVARIVAANSLPGVDLHPGQSLTVSR